MASGKPFHKDEIKFVEENMGEYPAILARSLGLYYGEHNGGSRNTKSVSILMNKIRTGRAPDDPDLPEDESLEPNTLMRDLPAVKPLPQEPVAAVPVDAVAEIGTKEVSDNQGPDNHVTQEAVSALPAENVAKIATMEAEPPADKPEPIKPLPVAAKPQTQVQRHGKKGKGR